MYDHLSFDNSLHNSVNISNSAALVSIHYYILFQLISYFGISLAGLIAPAYKMVRRPRVKHIQCRKSGESKHLDVSVVATIFASFLGDTGF